MRVIIVINTSTRSCDLSDNDFSIFLIFREFPLSETMGLYLFDAYRDRKNAKEMFSALTTAEQDRFISIDVSRVKTTHFNLTSAMQAYLIRQGQRAVDIYYPTNIYPLSDSIR